MSEDLINSRLGTPEERISKHETSGVGLCSSPETSYTLDRREDSLKHVAINALGFDARSVPLIPTVIPHDTLRGR
jgi:hypothetical protein